MEEKRRGSTKKRKPENQAFILLYPTAWSENTDVGWRPLHGKPGSRKKNNKSLSYA